MTLKTCERCKINLTTKNSQFIEKTLEPALSKKMLWFRCKSCSNLFFKELKIRYRYMAYGWTKILDLPKKSQLKAWNLKKNQSMYFSLNDKTLHIIKRIS